MKAVHAVGWYFPDSLGGTEVYVAAIARDLRRAGLDVRIAAPRPGASGCSEYEHEGVPVFRYPIPAVPTRAEARGECTVRGAEAFHRWLRAQRPDVVHVHTFVTGLELPEVEQACLAGARVFVTSHSSALGYSCLRGTLLRWGSVPCDGRVEIRRCTACALHQRGVPRVAAWGAAAVTPAVARRADRLDHPLGTAIGLPAYIARRAERQRRLFDAIEIFYVLTAAARDVLLANGAPSHKVRVNPLGVDTDLVGFPRPRPRPPTPPITIGYLGRLDPEKGLDDLLRAMRSLDRHVPVRLQIRGGGAHSRAPELRRACREAAGEDGRIHVGGEVERGEVPRLLASWDVLCCPSRSLEGGPTVALEAMAVGTPVIGTRIGGLAEIVEHGENGFLVPPRDWRALARIIEIAARCPDVIDRWRARLPAIRSMHDVAAEYLSAYLNRPVESERVAAGDATVPA